MGLRDKLDDTKFRSLKYGGDTPGGGNSGQPYIKSPDLNDIDSGINSVRFSRFDDGLVRGGALGAINHSATDVIRIGKFFTDFPKGPLFLSKQVGLQLSNPRIESRQLSTNNPTSGQGIFNNITNLILNTGNAITNTLGPTRIYNLGINTLAQVGVNAFGQHIKRHGLTPVQNENTLYFNVVRENDKDKNSKLIRLARKFNYVDGVKKEDLSRLTNSQRRNVVSSLSLGTLPGLVQGLNNFLNVQNQTIDNYISGPDSVYGIGSTTIKRYEPFLRTFTEGEQDIANSSNIAKIRVADFKITNAVGRGTNAISNYRVDIEDSTTQNTVEYKNKTYGELRSIIDKKIFSKAINNRVPEVRSEKGLIPKNAFSNYEDSSNPLIPNSNQGILFNDYKDTKKDFTERVIEARQEQVRKIARLESKFNVDFKKLYTGNGGGEQITILGDGKASTYPYFEREDDKILILTFSPIDPFTGQIMETINFLGYVKGIRETNTSELNVFSYIGRGEKFYTYNGITRAGSFSFQVPNFKKEDKDINKKKCELLSKIAGGKYNIKNLLGGIITRINLGGHLVNTPVFLTNFDFTIPDDTSWDLLSDVESEKRAMVMEVNVSYNIIGDELWAYRDVDAEQREENIPPPVPEEVPQTNNPVGEISTGSFGSIFNRVNQNVPDSTYYRFKQAPFFGETFRTFRGFGGGSFGGAGSGISGSF